ncbi:squamosa promoter-binding protein [Striga asiatica]|uniref:Squamosa promoter-binding protein n=1 Tax=Striga asiatica TaxID=4170 RepID=A0A5A7PH10_STRAF|nr:squamosa promoter-binding protein [Striga asiatica]
MSILLLLNCPIVITGNNEDQSGEFSPAPEKGNLLQILGEMNSRPLPENLASNLPLIKTSSSSFPNRTRPERLNQTTMDLLAALSSETQSQLSFEGRNSEKSRPS